MSEPLKLARELAHDLRAGLHGLSMALEMAEETMPPEAGAKTRRYLSLAAAEAAQLDRTIEQLSLWLRLQGGDYRLQPERIDLREVLAERLVPDRDRQPAFRVALPDGPFPVAADPWVLAPALSGLRDFMQGLAVAGEPATVRLEPDGRLLLSGPAVWDPVFAALAADRLPDRQVTKGPVSPLIGPALAVAVCRACGGSVGCAPAGGRSGLLFTWFRA
ncbi:MAG TPA: histidine kinase dimerization/phospho-acceptor domain-containing protein [Symbiobacteriaceae bacterium]|jgi:hypothetical protein